MTLEQPKVKELAAAKDEVGEKLSDHIRHCARCGDARQHRQPSRRCLRGKQIAGVLADIEKEYKAAKAVMLAPYPGQLAIDEAIEAEGK